MNEPVTQVACPDEIRYVPPPREATSYESGSPGVGLKAGGYEVRGMAVGDRAWIITRDGLFEDDRGNLWVSGVSYAQPFENEDRPVLIERVEAGMRVLTWPTGKTIPRRNPNPFINDTWVVEFPR